MDSYTLIQVIIVFLFSLCYLRTRNYEEQESIGKYEANMSSTEHIESIENLRNYQVQRAVQLIKDYKFKAKLSVEAEVVLLAFISSISCTILVLPYALLFLIICLTLSLTGSSKSVFKVSMALNLVFLALLLIDLPAKYLIKGSHFGQDDSSMRFFNEVVGLLSSTPTYYEFYLKILLFLVECQKIQYGYNYEALFNQIKSTHGEKQELQRIFRKRAQFSHKIFKPISIFAFSFLSIMFTLSHPSMILLVLLPIFIFGFFLTATQYRGLSKIIVVIAAIFVLASSVSQIVYLVLPSNQTKEDYIIYAEKILGIKKDVQITNEMFPSKLDYFFCLIMAFFSSYISKSDKTQEDLDSNPLRMSSILRDGYEEDILTIPDDVSEVRSRISYKTPPNLQNQNFADKVQLQIINQKKSLETGEILNEDKLEDENEEQKQEIKTINTQVGKKKSKQIWNSQRDDTLRGKMRRCLFKGYLKLRIYMDKLVNMMTIHCSKFSLFIIFLVSVSKPNLLNASLFLAFLWISVTQHRNIRSNWKYPIIVDSLIIIFLYALDALQPQDIFDIDPSILNFIGIQLTNGEINLIDRLWKYFPYLGLLIVLVLTHYIMNSERFEQFLQNLFQLEQESGRKRNEGFEEQSFLHQESQNYIGLTDTLSKFIVQHSIYFLILAMFIQCALPPASLLNLTLLVLLIVVLFKFFFSNTQIELYEKLHNTLALIKWISFIVLFLKYILQFQNLIQNISSFEQQDVNQLYLTQRILEKIMGVDRSQYISVKLFSLALVMVISSYQLEFNSHPLLKGILREYLLPENKLLKIRSTKMQQVLHHMKVYLLVFVRILLYPIPLILTLNYTLGQPSIIGALLIGCLIAITRYHSDTFWKDYYQSLGACASLAIILTYAGYFSQMFFQSDSDLMLLQWVGVTKMDKNLVFFPLLIQLFTIISICCILKYLSAIRISFKPTVTLQEIGRLEAGQNPDLTEDDEPNLELVKLKAIYEYETPIRVVEFIWDRLLKVFFYTFAFQIMVVFSMVVVLIRLDFSSVMQGIMAVIIMNEKYYPFVYKESPQAKTTRNQLSCLIKWNLLFISIQTMSDYMMSIGSPQQFDFMSWKLKFASYLCYDGSLDCSQDWIQWLGISGIESYYICLDFAYLLITYFNLYFVDERLTLDPNQILEQPKLNDEGDFLSNNYKGTKIHSFFCQLVFNLFPYLLILALMIFATMFHGSGSADLISTVYLFHAFYYIVNFRQLYTKNTNLIKYLKYYNIFVLFAVIGFQTPMFICPSVKSYQGSFTYIRVQQCSQLLLDNLEDQRYSTTNSYLATYIVTTQSIGFIKIYKIQIDFIVLMAIVQLQDYIFHHPYFQEYVLQHMKVEKETDSKLRAFIYVEQTHLGVLWSYKGIKEEIRILHQRLMRINSVIKDNQHSKLFLNLDEEDVNERDQLLDLKSRSGKYNMKDITGIHYGELLQELDSSERAIKEEKINAIVEEYTVKIEEMALNLLSIPNTPIIPLKLFISTFRSYLLNSETFSSILKSQGDEDNELKEKFLQDSLIDILKKLQLLIYDKHRNDLYQMEGIGLNFVLQNGTDPFPQQFEDQFDHRKDYEDMLEIRERYANESDSSTIKKLQFYFRSFLWMTFINKNLFHSQNQKDNKDVSPYTIPLFKLLSYCVLSQSQNICYLGIFLNFIINPNIINLLPPLSGLLYAMLDYPVPSIRYWKFLMIYMFFTIALKFIYQLPIFCGTPPYSLFSIEGCQTSSIPPEILLTRIDYVIGIRKFAGPSSFPRDQGILQGMIGDILVLLALLVLKNYLIKVGLWHFVKTKNNIYLSPAFKCKKYELSQGERLQNLRKENYKVYEYEQSSILGKAKIHLQQACKYCQGFVLKLMPQFMDAQQKNLNMRTQEEREYIVHNPKRVKPGKDYFSNNFFALLLILIYNLLWFRSVTGETQTVALSSANLQRFSTGQVILLFLVLLLMMIERMLFRTRYFDSKTSFGSSSPLSKHQLTAKLALHVFLVISVHIWLGFVIPRSSLSINQRKTPLIFSYLIWVYYFISSANQIRYGYPQAPFKPPFTRDTSFFNYWSFRIFKAIPFLWEMKVIIDWTVTYTSLDLYQWFKIDDAFNYLYQNQQQNNDRLSRPESQQRPWYEKFFQGFCFAFGLILVILAPILLFSGINPIMVKNPVLSGQLSMSFELNANGNSYNILQTQAFRIQQLSDQEVASLSMLFSPINVQFNPQDMQRMYFSPYSEVEWQISPPSLQKFVDDFNDIQDFSTAFVDVKSSWTFKRNNPIGNEAAQSETKIRMNAQKLQPIIDLVSKDYQASNGDIPVNQSTIYVENIFPKVLKLGQTQQAQLMEMQPLADIPPMTSISLTLNRPNQMNLYWTFSLDNKHTIGSEEIANSRLDHLRQAKNEDMVLIVYNEEVIGAIFGSAFQFSVVGLYATIVIAIGRFLRLIFDRISQRVIYEEMKNTELLFEICEGIFIAQVEGDLVKEKRLYELLISTYRSPETLIKITGVTTKGGQLRGRRNPSNSADKQQ